MNRSESIKELTVALAKAQSQITAAVKDKVNPAYRSSYADLASVWDACREPLNKNGLAVSQLFAEGNEDVRVTVHTMLLHSSGEWLMSSLSLPVEKRTPQAVGSAITYARRYALAAIVGVCADEDDDGNAASRQEAKPPVKKAVVAAVETTIHASTSKASSDEWLGLISDATDAAAMESLLFGLGKAKQFWTPADTKRVGIAFTVKQKLLTSKE